MTTDLNPTSSTMLGHGDKIVFKPAILAFVAFAATLPLFSPNIAAMQLPALPTSAGPVLSFFVYPMLVVSVVTGIVSSAHSLRHPVWQCPSARFLLGSTVFYVAGTLGLFIALHVDLANSMFALAAGICCGIGIVPLTIAWGCFFSTMNMRNALFWSAVVCGCASLLTWALSSLPPTVVRIVWPALFLTGAMVPCILMFRHTLVLPDVDTASVDADKPSITAAQQLKRLASVLWLPFTGLILYAFMTSLRKLAITDTLQSELLGGMVAAVCVLPLCLLKTDKPLLDLATKIMFPVAAGILIVLDSFPFGTAPQYWGAVGVYVFFSFIAIIALATLVGITHAGEFRPPLIFGMAIACGSSACAIGLLVASNVQAGDGGFGPLLMILASCYFATILVSVGVSAWRSLTHPDETRQTTASFSDEFDARCQKIADAAGLSRRESETLHYLGRGYSPAFVAKALVVSDSTARTHVKNIYRKLGISSREELLQKIDGEKL